MSNSLPSAGDINSSGCGGCSKDSGFVINRDSSAHESSMPMSSFHSLREMLGCSRCITRHASRTKMAGTCGTALVKLLNIVHETVAGWKQYCIRMMRQDYSTSAFGLFHSIVWSVALIFPSAIKAEYLPDAATHLGTIFINQDDLYTKDALATLSIQAIDNGSGITEMQFSNDDRNWSAPEPYATNKPWQLEVAPQDFPPVMNTVLKTVYVRVHYGNGTWSKAFSDGIIFAKSAQDIPIIKEVWILQQRPANYDGNQPQGSQLNPYIIAAGANEAAFDSLMNSLAKIYVLYRAAPALYETEVPPMDGVAVMYLHIGPGLYQTHGDNGGRGSSLSWSPTDGGWIRGAGKDSTILRLVGGNTNPIASVIGNYGGPGMAVYNNLEISDLTVDANMHEGGNISSAWMRTGVLMAGNNLQLRRLRVKGFGSRIGGLEPGGMSGHNAGAGNLYHFHVEDCEVIAPQKLNKYNPLMIGYEAGGQDSQGNPYYMINAVIRNNYVNGLMYDGNVPINPYTNSFFERGSHGIGLGGTTNSIIEDNLVEHVFNGYYTEIYDLNDVLVRNNHFRDVITGLNFNTGAADSLRYEGNLIELDPHYYTTPVSLGTGPSDYGWRRGVILNETLRAPINHALIISNTFQFTDRVSPTPPLAGGLAIVCLSGSADFENNTTLGLKDTTIRWYQGEGFPITFYELQADILDPTRLPPVITTNNRREDGTIIEVYPYVLDRTLPRPVVIPNQTITFPAPLLNGTLPTMVTGLPLTNLIDQNGMFNWTPGSNNIGRYVVSFYDLSSRTNDPRRTLITVQSGLTNQDPFYFMSGLRGYWRLGEYAGSTLRDSSGSSNQIEISPMAQNYVTLGVTGRRPGQKAVHFENANPIKTATLTIPNDGGQLLSGLSPGYQPYVQRITVLNQPFTASYWFKCDHTPTNYEVIFNYGSMVVCGVANSSDTNNNIAEVFCYYGYSPDLTFYQDMHPQHIKVTTGEWHHLVFVYDGLSTRIHIDGDKQAEIPCGQLEDYDPNNLVYLGGGWGGDNYLGCLSDVAIWNRPLSEAEIIDLYSSQKQSGAFPGLRLPLGVQNLRVLQ